MHCRRHEGFTLIELLTVIAIIALLAAILFPVFSRVRESGRKTTCMTNMHQIYVAVSMFRTDNGSYPNELLAPYQAGVAANQVKNSPLYPQYIKDISIFHCPDDIVNDMTVQAAGTLFYQYDSYDITQGINPDGTPAAAFIQTYKKDWTGGSGTTDAPNQLKYNNPPPDKTVLTWCNYHVTTAGANMCPVIFLSGTAKTIGYKEMAQYGWQIGNQQ